MDVFNLVLLSAICCILGYREYLKNHRNSHPRQTVDEQHQPQVVLKVEEVKEGEEEDDDDDKEVVQEKAKEEENKEPVQEKEKDDDDKAPEFFEGLANLAKDTINVATWFLEILKVMVEPFSSYNKAHGAPAPVVPEEDKHEDDRRFR